MNIVKNLVELKEMVDEIDKRVKSIEGDIQVFKNYFGIETYDK